MAFGRLRGFSGTADNRQLLPLGVQQYDDEWLKHTDGRALRSLCDPGMGGPSQVRMVKEKEPLKILEEILLSTNTPQVSVLIDCGALLTGMSNRQVAQGVLDLCSWFRAAIYFDDDNQILVLDRDGKDTPLAKSPLQPAHGFTYLDDKHTRGTDLRFAPDAVGAVTICKKTTKDRLVQACMRMRSLGLGQTVMLFLDSEAGRQLAAEAGQQHMQPRPVPSLGLVLAYVTARTAEELKSAIVHWALQGAAFAVRMPFLQHVSNGLGAECRTLAKLCREPEEFQLTSYCQSLSTRPSAEEIPRRAKESPKRILKTADLSEQEVRRWEEEANIIIKSQLLYLHHHQLLCSEDVLVTSMDEEQEREREQEKEREREVEIEMEAEICPPAIQAHKPLPEKHWEWSRALQPGFVADCLSGSPGCPCLFRITADELEQRGTPLPQLQDLRVSHVFATDNFLSSVKIVDANCGPLEKAHAARPVDVYVLAEGSVILLSGWEAGHVLRETRCLSKQASQRATQAEDFPTQLNHISDGGKTMSVCPRGFPKLPDAQHRAVLKLFNGSCDYPRSEIPELAKFLGLLEPSCIHSAARHHGWTERQCRRLWDVLRDMKVLGRNGFVKQVPSMEDSNLKEAVETVLEQSEIDYAPRMVWFHKLLTQISSGHKNPAAVVPEFVRFRLQGHLFQGSSLEELLDL